MRQSGAGGVSIRTALPAALLLSLPAPVAAASSCDFLPEEAMPGWVQQLSTDGARFYGVGLQQQMRDTQGMVDAAQANAIADLAQNIEVDVRAQFTSDVTLRRVGERELTEAEISDITETISRMTLEEVATEDQWLDRDSCVLWTLVSITREKVRELRRSAVHELRIELVEEALARADDDSLGLTDRNAALAVAESLVDATDFSLLFEGYDEASMRVRIEGIGSVLDSLFERRVVPQERLSAALGELEQARSTSDFAAGREAVAAALGSLRQVIADFPFGSEPNLVAENAAFAVADAEVQRGDRCAAKMQYQIVVDRSRSEEWRGRAAERETQIPCNQAGRDSYLLRRALDGRRVAVVCTIDLGTGREPWSKPCDAAASFIQAHGGIAEDDESAATLVLEIAASGQLNTRENARNPNGVDYQFSGSVSTRMTDSGETVYSDEYSGVGGWNPISQAMALEVLGVHASRRFEDGYKEMVTGG